MCSGFQQQLSSGQLSCAEFLLESHDVDSVQVAVVIADSQVEHAQAFCARSSRAILVDNSRCCVIKSIQFSRIIEYTCMLPNVRAISASVAELNHL